LNLGICRKATRNIINGATKFIYITTIMIVNVTVLAKSSYTFLSIFIAKTFIVISASPAFKSNFVTDRAFRIRNTTFIT